MHKNIPTVAGVRTRFICTISGQADEKLAGYVMVDGERRAMELSHSDTLIAPITPAGDYLYEIRCGGAVVVWGHLCARPSAFPPAAEDMSTISISAERGADNTVVKLDIALTEGPRGQDGKSPYVQGGHVFYWDDSAGEWRDGGSLKGEPGQDGASPTAAEVAEALLPNLSSTMIFEGPSATNNWHVSWFEMGSAYLQGGVMLTKFGYRCRFDSMADCTTEAVYLGIWELGEDGESWHKLGASTNTQQQQQSVDVIWEFEPGAVKLSGRPVKFCLLGSPDDDWRTDLTMGMRVSGASYENTRVHYNASAWSYLPKYFMEVARPASGISIGGGGGGTIRYTLTSAPQRESDEMEYMGSGKGFAVYCFAGLSCARIRAIRGMIESDDLKPIALQIGSSISSAGSLVDRGSGKVLEWVFDPPVCAGATTRSFGADGREIVSMISVFVVYADTGLTVNAAYAKMGADDSTAQLSARVPGLDNKAITGLEIDYEWDSESDMADEFSALSKLINTEREQRKAADDHAGVGASSTAVGKLARAEGENSTALGSRARAAAPGSLAAGYGAEAEGDEAIAIGEGARAAGDGSFALGFASLMHEDGCGVLTCSPRVSEGTANLFTNLILIGAESRLANIYTGGEAGLGYIVREASGRIIKRGCIRLADLCREHADDFDAQVGLNYDTSL